MGNNLEELFNLLANGIGVLLGLFFVFVPKQIRAAIVPGKSWAMEKHVRWIIGVGIGLVVVCTLFVADQLFFHLGGR